MAVWAKVDQPPTRVRGKLLALYHVYGWVGKGVKSSLFIVPPSTSPGSPDAKGKDHLCGYHYVATMGDLGKELREHFGKRKFAIIRDRAP